VAVRMSETRSRSRGRNAVRAARPRALESPSSESSKNTEHATTRTLWVSLALVAIILIVYGSSWSHEFTDYDDPDYVTENPHVTGGLTAANVSWAFTTAHAANWHPVTWLSHMADVSIYGVSPRGHHVTNVLLHIAGTLMLFLTLHKMTSALGRSAFVAGLFAVHPLHVESVAWVAERKDVLGGLFWMLTIWAYAAYVRNRSVRQYATMLGLFALALMSKPTAVTLPFVLLLLDVWPLQRLSYASVREKLPLFVMSLACSFVTFYVQQGGRAVAHIENVTLYARVSNAAVTYVTYIAKTIWPSRLAVFYPLQPPLNVVLLAAIVLLLGATSLLTVWRAKVSATGRYMAVGWLWYLGTLVPMIGLVQVGDQARADRYTYLPLIGLFILIAWGVPQFVATWPSLQRTVPIAGVVIILLCTLTARAQASYWKNSSTLWSHALDVTSNNHIAQYSLANVLARTGRTDEAVHRYQEAIRLRPGFAEAHERLGILLALQDHLEEAVRHYSQALRLNPRYAEAHGDLGSALARLGDSKNAIAHFSEALRLRPDDAVVHNNLGAALANQGDFRGAIDHFAQALRIDPQYRDAQNNLAAAQTALEAITSSKRISQ
jgi:Flp pilus assembly protein TadD